MNCAECRENLVAWLEGLLEGEQAELCRAHLENCPSCRAEYEAIAHLQQMLVASGRAAAEVSVVVPVMQRVHQAQIKPERITLMSRIMKHRWGFGFGALASAAAAILILILLSAPNVRARAVEVMARGAQAVARLSSVHLKGQLRTLPADNFGTIMAELDFQPIEMWKEFDPELKWRIEKPGRVVVMDGKQTVMLIKPGSTAVKIPQRTTSAFDTDWLQRIANLSGTITNELKNALARGWKLSVEEQTGADGRAKSVVTVMAKSGVPDNDYCKNTFMENADTRRVYRFDAQTELLEGVQLYLVRPGSELQIFELSQIDYNQPIDATNWSLQLPANVSWARLSGDVPRLPDNEKYAAMTVEDAARAFFEACSREDWDEVGKFISPVNDRLKKYLGGLELVSVGQSFTSQGAAGRFVPYEIKLRSHELGLRVSNANSARRCVITGVYDDHAKLIQDLSWKSEPAVLPNNEVYAAMSPMEAVKAYFEAAARFDWDEMRKFAPDYDVANDKAQIEAAQKHGMDIQKNLPVREAVQAVWSADQSAWVVKFRQIEVKKWNLGLRKDNPAGRWQVGGGI